MGTRQVELALALEPAWPWLALVATHAGTGAWPMAARTCVWQGARPPGSGISSAWLMADAGLCPGSRRLETFNLTSRQMSEKPRREQATAPPPPLRPGQDPWMWARPHLAAEGCCQRGARWCC